MPEEIKEYIPETIPEFKLSEDIVPGLTEDKIDASISVRGLDAIKTYTGEVDIGVTTDQTINVGFRPKYIYIDAFYTTPSGDSSKGWCVENNDGTITVMLQYGGSTRSSGGSGLNTAIDIFFIDSNTHGKIGEITDTGFTVTDISRNNTFTLQIYAEG